MLQKALLALCLVVGFQSIWSSFAADLPQARKVWRIAFLGNTPPTTPETQHNWDAFRQALQERGYVEGSNLVVERRDYEGKPERAPDLATELVRLDVDVMVAATLPAALAAKAATSTIPIVAVNIPDPVGVGLVASLARPGGNITGIGDYVIELAPKRLELLKDALPGASRVALIRCTKCSAPATTAAAESTWASAAQKLGMSLTFVDLNGPQGFDDATAAVQRARPDAIFLSGNPVVYALRKELADFATRERLPVFAFSREQAILGSLMTFGISQADALRQAAVQVDKIFKGTKPSDLPFEQPTKLELVINLKTAKSLGIVIPPSLLLRADEVIK